MKQFVDKSINNLNFLSYKFARLHFLLSDEDAIILFKQAVMPHFDYCSFLVESCTVDRVAKLQVIQNRMLRCIRRVTVGEESSLDLHDLCEIPFLASRRKELLMSLIYSKAKKGPPPPPHIHRRGIRNDHKLNFRLPFPHTACLKRCPAYRGVELWNSLPHDIQRAEKKITFKSKTKKWFGNDMKGKEF